MKSTVIYFLLCSTLSCQVNLKEQGQLIRQDEFTVLFRKKKCVRRIFLFEHLILFSKTKKTDVGNDVYVYKQSFKVSTQEGFNTQPWCTWYSVYSSSQKYIFFFNRSSELNLSHLRPPAYFHQCSSSLCSPLSDEWYRDDPQHGCERPVFWDLVPPEEERGHLHPEGFQHGGEESLDHRPGEDPVGSGHSQ